MDNDWLERAKVMAKLLYAVPGLSDTSAGTIMDAADMLLEFAKIIVILNKEIDDRYYEREYDREL